MTAPTRTRPAGRRMIGKNNYDGRTTTMSSYFTSILERRGRRTFLLSASSDSGSNEDGEAISSGSPAFASSAQMLDPILKLPQLEAESASLKTMINQRGGKKDNDDDEKGMVTKLRQVQSEMDDIKATAEFSVRKTQYRFYEAFSNGDIDAMRDVWSSSKGCEGDGDGGDDNESNDDVDDVRCIHPGMESIDGYENIMSSWEQIFGTSTTTSSSSSSSSSFTIEPERSKIKIHGITAICSCIEKTQPGDGMLECLNIYRREDGEWKMILHMASPIVMRTSSGDSGGGGGGGSAFFF